MRGRQRQSLLVGCVLVACVIGTAYLSVAETIHYTYDAMNRVSTVAYEDRQALSFTYDKAGNRLTQHAFVPTPTPTPTPTPQITPDAGRLPPVERRSGR